MPSSSSSSGAGAGSSSGSPIFQFGATKEAPHHVTDPLTQQAAAAAANGCAGASSSTPPAAASSISSSISSSMEAQQRVGLLGEAFVFSLLQHKLPGFDESCWRSSARQYWPRSVGPTPLQPPDVDPSFDFLYEDVEGELSGTPGTLCYIECKATSDNAAADSSGLSTHSFHISPKQWELARLVKLRSTPEQPQLFVVMCVDRVGRPGGPRLVSVLKDPVGMAQAGQLWVTGQELQLCDFPVCLQ